MPVSEQSHNMKKPKGRIDASCNSRKEEKECYECKSSDEPMLICAKCNCCIHARCTKLPTYILQRFIAHDDSYCCFLCEFCVEVPKWRQQMFANQNDEADRNMKELLREELKKTEGLYKENNALKNIIKTKDYEMMELKRKIRTIGGNYADKMIKKQENKINNADKTNCKQVLTYASVTLGNQRKIDNVIKETQRSKERDHEKVEKEKHEEERACNIIVHGKEETNDGEDIVFVRTLMEALKVECETPIIRRIGRNVTNKNRPIKMKFNSHMEKRNVMKNLSNLKGLREFERISIRDDYTWLQRVTIKGLVEKARKRNEAEPPDSDTV